MRKRVFLVLTAFALAFAARAQYGPVGFVNYNDGCNGITGVGEVLHVEDVDQNTTIYDLQGRKVSSVGIRPGIYIINRKKVVVK